MSMWEKKLFKILFWGKITSTSYFCPCYTIYCILNPAMKSLCAVQLYHCVKSMANIPVNVPLESG